MPKAPPKKKAGARAKPAAKQPAKRPAHRPSSYTPAMAKRVIAFFKEGGTRHGLDRNKSLPSWTSFQRWMERYPDLRSQYVRAKEDQADALFEEALDEVRTCQLNGVAVALARVRADVLLRAAARRKPKVYSERVTAAEIAAGREVATAGAGVPERKYVYEIVTTTHKRP